MEFSDGYLIGLRNAINWILGFTATIGIFCLIVGIIMIVASKRKEVKKGGIIMVCILPMCVVLWFIVSIVFYFLGARNGESLEQEVVSRDNGSFDIKYN